MKSDKLANIFLSAVVLWAVVSIVSNFLIPQTWFVDYKELHAVDVCRDSRQQLTGTRWVPWDMRASGVDQLWSYQEERYVDRFEWSDGEYTARETQNGWKVLVTNKPGQYRWDATTLKVVPFPFVTVHIDDVNSNDFNILDCE